MAPEGPTPYVVYSMFTEVIASEDTPLLRKLITVHKHYLE